MTIKPLKSYPTPAYPAWREAKQERLLEHVPRRWRKNNSIAALLGTGGLFITSATCMAQGGDAVDAEAVVESGQKEQKPIDAAETVRAIPVTRVAPILEETLATDGRGTFGCVAVSAPVFLSENEALDIIQGELEKAGLKMRDIASVDGFKVPEIPTRAERAKRHGERGRDYRYRLRPLKDGAYTFDLGTEDNAVVVKFLQRDDFYKWEDDTHMMSTASSVDLAWLATQMGGVFKEREEGAPVIIGLFIDPMTDDDYENVDTRGLTLEQINLLWGKQQRENADERAREKLRMQIMHFIEYLKRENVLENKN